ncbi:hypothetical protein MNEG_1452 [Monoraphidium neglectum]|uniref:NLE domain-containing protein n=1 Tax=Monoraphidium neglectum TaxID=145388 RepID=A0A0D2MVE3_9CHLO|nr:hypothetical protein MNEG_1452 [Monoraphidium neglectum]KIZ06505.1 hypothetical protein MNEG_1452 [Monoraphidium neglectum]|eukprot:XP_013905524.1 hypothetical protein MNEG_1452 [Monoraphidium neglectum]
MAAEESQVLVRFFTKLPQELQVPDTEVAVPSSLKRYGLSQVINHLLALDPPRPFDFLIDGELLRKSLAQHLLDHGLSPTGVYGFAGQGSCLASFAAHPGGVTAAAWLPAAQGSLMLTAGKDAAVHLWQLPAAAGATGADSKIKAGFAAVDGPTLVSSCLGHSDTVAALATNHAGDLAATGGWDGKLLLWQTGGLLASGGWDHSVRLWDVVSGRAVATYNGSKAVYAVAAAPVGSSGVLVFGGADTCIRVWDSRARGEALSVKGYAAGDSWLAGLAWRPEGGGGTGSEHHVAGVSHDGSMRMWDLRTSVPLGTVKQHANKALAVTWWGPHTIASGGADCKLQLYELLAEP